VKTKLKSLLTVFLSVTLVFGMFSNVSIVKAADSCITIDGETNDWDYIGKYATDEGGFAQVAAFTTDDALYILRDLSDVTGYANDQIFIDADGDTTNGYAGYGIDYMLQGTTLYYYSGIAGAWGWGGSQPYEVKFSGDKVVGEYRIPLSSIGNPKGKVRVNIGAVKSDWTMLACYPAVSTSLAEVPTYDEIYTESTAEPIRNFALNPAEDLKAITTNTMAGGTVGTFSAEGGDGNYSYVFAASAVYGKDNSKFVIEGNKLVVKEGLLSPGSYSVYVKVSSDIRSEKKAFSFIIDAADAAVTIDESVFAGKNGQWFAVNHNTANSEPNLTEIKAVTDGYYLYAYVGAASLSNSAEFYIGTASQAGFDMTDTWSDAEKVTYKVSVDGTIYAADNGQWTAVGNAECYKTGVGAEIKVDLSLIGNAVGTIAVAVKDGESNILPNVGEEMLKCSTPTLAEVPAITLDGDASDWTGIAPIASGSGTLGNLYALRDNNNLYVMTTVKDPNFNTSCAVSTNLLINADGDPTTGYQHGSYTRNSGADFLVQDWFSNNYGSDSRNIEFFYTQQETWKWTAVSGNNNYKAYAEAGEGVFCIEYILPINDMKNVSNSLSDDFYIAVDRENLQSETPAGASPAGNSFVKVPKYNTTVSVSVGDSSFADWDQISNKASNTATDALCNFLATRSAERLYTLVTSDIGGLNTVNTYYISTNDQTGYTISGYENVDYIVRDANLYQVIGENEISESLGAVWMDYYDDSTEMQLYLSQIGNPSTIKIAWRGVDGSYAIPTSGFMNVTATFSLGREEGYYYPTEDFSSFGNPYKGWVGWATRAKDDADGAFYNEKNAVYLAFRWSELEPEKGKFDIEGIKEKYDLDYWKSKGVRINVRFVMDNPEVLEEGQESRMDIPQWLYEELQAEVAKGNIDSAGTFYNDVPNLGGAGFSPNYNSALLIKYHERAIEELAKYFDDNSISAFVQIGSLGHWGEFHTWPEGTGVFPNPSTCAKYMEAYTKYFKNVKLGLRKPYPYAAENGFGLFNDIFGTSQFADTYSYLGYINNGDTDMPYATDAEVKASAMPNFWKTNYSGGEFAQGDVRLHVTNEGVIGCLEQLRDTHVSWLGPCSPADMENKEILSSLYEANILALQKKMGYNFALERVSKISETISIGTETAVNMIWNNEGVAPFYYNWPLELSLIDQSGNVVFTQAVDGNITDWMPGRTSVDVKLNVDSSVKSGTYTLAIAVLDKDSLKPAMKLAISGGRDDLRYPLYSVEIKNNGNGGNNGKNPIENAISTVTNVVKNVVSGINNWLKNLVGKIFGKGRK